MARVTRQRDRWLQRVDKDTLAGTARYGHQEVATASMGYKSSPMSLAEAYKLLEAKELNLKLIPSGDGVPEIAQLVSLKNADIKVHEAWKGPARLSFAPHVNAPFAGTIPTLEQNACCWHERIRLSGECVLGAVRENRPASRTYARRLPPASRLLARSRPTGARLLGLSHQPPALAKEHESAKGDGVVVVVG